VPVTGEQVLDGLVLPVMGCVPQWRASFIVKRVNICAGVTEQKRYNIAVAILKSLRERKRRERREREKE